MEIRGPNDGRPVPPPRPRTGDLAPQPPAARPGGRDDGPRRDGFARQGAGAAEEEAPFWLLAMNADRRAKRRYLDAAAAAEARRLEAAWIARWAATAGEAAARGAFPGDEGPAALAAWAAIVAGWCAASGAPIGAPRVAWVADLGAGGEGPVPARGQYLFRADGGVLQLRPRAAGSRADWVATVAHETFHHAQHALLVAAYRGHPALDAPWDRLAAYYRDARAVYVLGLPPARHVRQDLEAGAEAFGRRMAKDWLSSP